MVAKIRLVTEDMTAEDWLAAASDEVLVCRGQGHDFAKLERTRSGIIKGFTVRPPREGIYQTESTCPRCKAVRIELTLPGGELPDPHRYRYVYPFYGPGDPRNYKPPKGVKVRRRAAFNETWRRTREVVLALAEESA
jgi:hypothetical protein